MLAVAAGSYDGGYLFQGELWWWNWETGERKSLLAASREVVRCRFDGDRVAILAMPPNDDEYEMSDRFGGVIDPTGEPVRDLDVDPATLAFDDHEPAADLAAEIVRLGIEPRSAIWDLAVLGDGRIAAGFDDGTLVLFRPTGDQLARHVFDGQVAQLLPSADQLLVNVTRYARETQRHISTMFALTGDALAKWKAFPTARACSIDAYGRVLARNTDREHAPDEILAPDGHTLLSRRLGHYDCFNHAVRIDGAPDLYFLQGRPKNQHEHKQLCRIDQSRQVHEVCAWDTEDSHLMVGSAVLLPGGDLVRSYRVHRPHPGPETIRVERMTTAGALVWRIEVGAVASALVAWPATNAIVFALVDTTLGIVDADTGTQHRLEPFVLDGLPTIVTALAVHEETLVVGTIDGRVVLYAAR